MNHKKQSILTIAVLFSLMLITAIAINSIGNPVTGAVIKEDCNCQEDNDCNDNNELTEDICLYKETCKASLCINKKIK